MYLNIVEVESAMLGLANQYPTLCSLITLPNQTAEGRTCHVMRIGAPNTPKIKGVLFNACAHAREWGGAEICVYFAADLLECYTNNSGLTYGNKSFTAQEIISIIEEVDLFVFPCVNPDGRHYSQTDNPDWRKNRNTANSNNDPAKIGVDINRNFDFLWQFNTAFAPEIVQDPDLSLASSDPTSDVYHGPSPHSEMETKNITWLFDTFPQIQWFIDIHSFAGDLLHSWGDAPNQSDDPSMNFLNFQYNSKRGVDDLSVYGEYIPEVDLATAETLAQKTRDAMIAVRGEPYKAHQSYYLNTGQGIYPTSGAVDDYSYSRHFADPTKSRVFAYTLEFGFVEFSPKWSEMEKIVLDIDAGLVEFCLQARLVFPVPKIHERESVMVLFGVSNDGGGAVISGGKIIRIPPWDPWIRNILNGLLMHEVAAGITEGRGHAVQQEALQVIIDTAQKKLEGMGP